MIWSKFDFLRALFPRPEVASRVSRRWMKARAADPDLAADLIVLGGVLVAQPADAEGVAPIDPHRLAYEAGRRDLALQLLAMMSLTPYELSAMLERNDAA